ncbi:MAG: LPP20 family lipoprotein [Bacteroidia bacterium]
MNKYLYIALLVLAASCSSKTSPHTQQVAERPDWVKQRPISSAYYIGIGVSRKINGGFDHMEQARKNAVNDLVGQIQVNIQANSIQSQLERNRVFSDEFRSFTRLSSNVAIEDYEIVDSWQNEHEYWVYYRLSVADYQRQKQRRMQLAIDQSLDAFGRARAEEQAGNLMGAYDFYFRALEAVKAYTGEPLQYTQPDGQQHFLGNDLLQSVNQLSRDIAIRVNQRNLKARIGQSIAEEILITVSYPRINGEPLRNFPLNIRFSQGAGTIVGNTSTDENGICRIRIANIAARDALQEILISPDLEGQFRNDRSRQIWLNVIDPQALPREKVIIEVSRPVMQIMANELAYGKPLSQALLQSAAKQRLSREGIRFTERADGVDYRLIIEADVRQGTVNSGMYTALLDIKLSLIDDQGNQKYSQNLSGIRGVQLDYQRAAEAAYRRAAEDLELTVIPKMLNVIYNL